MAIIDLVSWSPQENKTIYAWRFPQTNLSTYTQLIVQESQEAVLFSKGQIHTANNTVHLIWWQNIGASFAFLFKDNTA